MVAMFRFTRRRAATGVLTALLAAGCGDGGDETTAERFRRDATAACERYDRALRQVEDARSVAAIPRVIDRTDPLLRRLAADLGAVDAPDDLAAGHARLIAGAEDARRRLAGLRSAARSGDTARVRGLARAAQAADRATDRLARRLGLPACAEG